MIQPTLTGDAFRVRAAVTRSFVAPRATAC
ncbi:hypothetical protein DEU34_1220 [Microbacterium sp. AG1240]|nr:hypothetical protein DEU34_1220 [Microbacterium sp. AG1240]